MSVANRNSPPGRKDARDRRDAGVLHEAPLPVSPLRPRIGIEQIDARERLAAARRAVRPHRHDAAGCCRSPRSSIAASALAMPLTNGSHADEAGVRMASASAIRCSPPPKPISSRTSSTASKQRRRSAGAGVRQIEREARQQGIEKRRLARPQRVALAPAEESAGPRLARRSSCRVIGGRAIKRRTTRPA